METTLKRITAMAVAAGIVLIMSPGVAVGRTHKAYLSDLWNSSAEFYRFAEPSVDFDDGQTRQAAEALLKKTIKLFPSNEEIDYKDRKIPVDNTWIAVDAATFARETDPSKEKEIMISIGQRFEAIAVQVEGIEYSGERRLTKDEEKSRLAEILKREEYRPADEGAESPAARIYRAIENWISSLFPRLEQPNPDKRADLTGLKTVLQVLIFILVAALLVYVVAKFGPQFLRKYRKQSKSGGAKIILGEEIGPEATTANLFAEAELLAGRGDIRGAIRKGYISLLFELSERRMIGLAKHKTNRDYLRDLGKHERVRTGVGGLTNNYERHWYGRQEARDQDWKEFRQVYIETLDRQR